MAEQLRLFNKADYMVAEKCCACNVELTEEDGHVPATDSQSCVLCRKCQKKYGIVDEKCD